MENGNASDRNTCEYTKSWSNVVSCEPSLRQSPVVRRINESPDESPISENKSYPYKKTVPIIALIAQCEMLQFIKLLSFILVSKLKSGNKKWK